MIIKKEKGSIAIYQLLIFFGIFILVGLLVDISRIMVAEAKVQNALDSAMRSSLACYDKDIYGEYGIFAVDTASEVKEGKTVDKVFLDYFKLNLNKNDNEKGIVNYELLEDRTSFTAGGGLMLDNSVLLENQIIEYMKYKYPINLSVNTIQKLKSSGVFKKSEYAKKEKGTRATSEKLKKNIDNANKNIEKINKGTLSLKQFEGKALLDALKQSIVNNQKLIKEVEDIGEKTTEYQKNHQEAINYAKEVNQDEALNQEGASINVNESEFEAVLAVSTSNQSITIKNNEQIENALNIVSPLVNELQSLQKAVSNLAMQNQSLIMGLSSLGPERNPQAVISLQEAISINSKSIENLQGQINEHVKKIEEAKSDLKLIENKSFQYRMLEDDLSEKPKGKLDYFSFDALKGKLSEYLGVKNISTEWLIKDDEFSKKMEDGYKNLIQPTQRDERIVDSKLDVEVAEEKTTSILKYLDEIYKGLRKYFEDAGTDSIKGLFVVDYIMDKFTYHTAQTERNHYFEKGEVEYILWNNNNQFSNITTAFTNIGFLRLSINTIDYFATSKVPNPVLRLVYSVGRGTLQTAKDVYELYKGNAISICPSLQNKKITYSLDYKDHLQIFLLIQNSFNEAQQFKNICQLIQVNSKESGDKPDFNLGGYATKLEAKVCVKINLIFIPMLRPQIFNDRFEGNSYIIEKSTNMSY